MLYDSWPPALHWVQFSNDTALPSRPLDKFIKQVLEFGQTVWTLGWDTVQSHVVSHVRRLKRAKPKTSVCVVFPTAEGSEYSYYPHCTDEETEAH